MDKNSENVILLMKLRQYKEEFMESLKKDLKNTQNYENSKVVFEKYRNVYYEITGEEPKNNFEYYVRKIISSDERNQR